MSHVEITLKSGTTVRADVSEWTTTRNALTNVLTGVEWKNAGPRGLSFIRVEEIDAVVFIETNP